MTQPRPPPAQQLQGFHAALVVTPAVIQHCERSKQKRNQGWPSKKKISFLYITFVTVGLVHREVPLKDALALTARQSSLLGDPKLPFC